MRRLKTLDQFYYNVKPGEDKTREGRGKRQKMKFLIIALIVVLIVMVVDK